MAVPDSFLRELRERIPVSDVAGRYTRLQRRGKEYVGLSPFNRERTPSFTVNDEKEFFHCFSSGQHGDIFTLLMKLENLTFAEAVEKLAAEAGLEVPQPSPEEKQRQQRRGSLYEAVEAACRWFEDQLHTSRDGAEARAYLERRGYEPETIAYFRLGYAPGDGQALKKHLVAEGFAEEQLVEAGLLKRGQRGDSYSFFRDRVMFPVCDRRGRVVAFGGRQIAGDGPKYLNTADTPLFQKSELLYALAAARAGIGTDQPAIAVEGYTDVIALHRAGFRGAVAPLGTALTEAQIAQLWRLDRRPYLCFDGDEAGQRAAWRAIARALGQLKPDHSLNIAFLPSGQDPDTLVQAKGQRGFQEVLSGAITLPQALWRYTAAGRKLDDPDDRAGLEAALEQLIARLPDRQVQYHYRQIFRDWLREAGRRRRDGRAGGFGRPSGSRAVGEGDPRDSRHRSYDPPRRSRPDARRRVRTLVATLLVHPQLFDAYGEVLAELETGGDRQLEALIAGVTAILSRAPDLDADGLARHLEERNLGQSAAALLASAREVEGHVLDAGDAEPARRLWDGALALRRREQAQRDGRESQAAILDPARENQTLAQLREAASRAPDGPGDEPDGSGS